MFGVSLTNDVTLIGEDTDLLVLLLHFVEDEPKYNLYFRSDRENRKKENILYDVNHYREILDKKLCFNLLFIHAFSSFVELEREQLLFNTLVKTVNIGTVAGEFMIEGNTKEKIEKAGEMAACIVCNIKEGESINTLRKRLLTTKVARASSFVKPEKMDPTKNALKFHSFRVYFQIMNLIGYD